MPANAASKRPVILLVAEAVTLAHFARIATLARALDHNTYQVVVASDPRYAKLDPELSANLIPLDTIAGSTFTQALAQGKPLYDEETLTRYVEADLALIAQVKPDLVVGDFRLSLAVSAPLSQEPYAAVVNAYWSPYAKVDYPIPDLPITRLLGVGLAQYIFDLARPLVFASHARPLNRVRRKFGLPALGHDLRHSYTWGDYTLYADVPEVVPTSSLPSHHRYLGPVIWSAQTTLPAWWETLPEDRPIVCLTLGSSGNAGFLPEAVEALSRLPISLLVATLGHPLPKPLPDNVFAADYLPLQATLRRAQLLICNGGSLSTYQAMALAVPVIGVCGNLDQLLNMRAVQRLGCGIALRAAGLAAGTLAGQVTELLRTSSPGCARMAELLRRHDSLAQFCAFVDEATAGRA